MSEIHKKRNEIKKQLFLIKQNIDRLIERENYFYFIDLSSMNNFSSFFFYTSILLSKRIRNVIDDSTIDKNNKRFKFVKKFKKIKNKNKNNKSNIFIFNFDVNIISIDRFYRWIIAQHKNLLINETCLKCDIFDHIIKKYSNFIMIIIFKKYVFESKTSRFDKKTS